MYLSINITRMTACGRLSKRVYSTLCSRQVFVEQIILTVITIFIQFLFLYILSLVVLDLLSGLNLFTGRVLLWDKRYNRSIKICQFVSENKASFQKRSENSSIAEDNFEPLLSCPAFMLLSNSISLHRFSSLTWVWTLNVEKAYYS